MNLCRCTLPVLILAVATARASAANITIDIDYSDDMLNGNFFGAHPAAKASLAAAAADLSSVLAPSLGATVDTNSAMVNGASATFNFRYSYISPSTNSSTPVPIADATLPANEIRIFVGARAIGGGTLGQGGPGGFGIGGSYTPNGNQADLDNAVAMATVAANVNMGRGDGPIIGPLSGSFNGPSTNYTVNFGSTIGKLSMDTGTNWQYDYTQPVGSNQYDFYSVALHELTHALGFGASQSWDNDVISATHSWTGPQAIALLGTGNGVLDAGGANPNSHIASGTVSTRLSDGAAQQAVMDPGLFNGQRKKFTRLDLAFLRDIGWQTIPYPLLVGDLDQNNLRTVVDVRVMMSALANLSAYKTSHGFSNSDLLTVANINGDSAVTNTDLQSLLCMLANDVQPPISPVPEPTAGALAAFGGLLIALSINRIRRR